MYYRSVILPPKDGGVEYAEELARVAKVNLGRRQCARTFLWAGIKVLNTQSMWHNHFVFIQDRLLRFLGLMS